MWLFPALHLRDVRGEVNGMRGSSVSGSPPVVTGERPTWALTAGRTWVDGPWPRLAALLHVSLRGRFSPFRSVTRACVQMKEPCSFEASAWVHLIFMEEKRGRERQSKTTAGTLPYAWYYIVIMMCVSSRVQHHTTQTRRHAHMPKLLKAVIAHIIWMVAL